jgi:hypothetical protein
MAAGSQGAWGWQKEAELSYEKSICLCKTRRNGITENSIPHSHRRDSPKLVAKFVFWKGLYKMGATKIYV